MKCCLVYLNLGPHHVARLKALLTMLPTTSVVEVAGRQQKYPWSRRLDGLGSVVHTLFPDCFCQDVPPTEQAAAVITSLKHLDPDVVVLDGYGEPVFRAAARWAQRRHVPTVLRFVSTYGDKPRHWWKEFLKGWIISGYSAIAATGRRAVEYAYRLGASASDVFRIGNPVDNSYFWSNSQRVRSDENTYRHRLDLPLHFFLTVSRLSPEKNLVRLVMAYDRYRKEGGGWDLVIVGSGPQKAELSRLACTQEISGIHLVDWCSYDELPTYYSLASCFVLPSVSEPWGLVVNEAMACGLPIIVSRACGCVPELCRAEENSYVFAPYSVEDLVGVLHKMSNDNEHRVEMGQASRRIIGEFDLGIWAESLAACIEQSQEKRPIRGSRSQ